MHVRGANRPARLRGLVELHFAEFGEASHWQRVVVVVIQTQHGHYVVDAFRDGVWAQGDDLCVAMTAGGDEGHVDDASTAEVEFGFAPFFQKQLDFPLAAFEQRYETAGDAPLEADVHALLTLDELVVGGGVRPAFVCAGQFAHGSNGGAFEFEGLGSGQVFFNFHDSHRYGIGLEFGHFRYDSSAGGILLVAS